MVSPSPHFPTTELLTQAAVVNNLQPFWDRFDVKHYSTASHEQWEAVMLEVIKQDADGSLTQVLSAVADRFIRCWTDLSDTNRKSWRTFSAWSHSMCHLFERFGYSSTPGESILDRLHHREIAERLIKAVTSAAIEAITTICVERILDALLRYNMAHLTDTTLRCPFEFKPECLRQSGIASLKGDHAGLGNVLSSFCDTATPYEFFERVLPVGSRSNAIIARWPVKVDPMLTTILLKEFEDRIPRSLLQTYLRELPELDGRPQTLEEISHNVSKARTARVIEHGIFVDVDGTLCLSTRRHSDLPVNAEGGQLNKPLVRILEQCIRQNQRVVVFTGGDPDVTTERLRLLGCPDSLLPVRAKSEFKEKLLELVIDDVEPGFQGFGAVNFLDARRLLGDGMLEKNGEQWSWRRPPLPP